MISWLMRRFARFPVSHPRAVIVACALITVGWAVFIPRLHVSTDRNLLSGTDNPIFERREEVNQMFGTALVAVVVVSGDRLDRVRAGADALAEALHRHDQVRDVFYRADVSFFERHALMFGTETMLEEVVKKIDGQASRFDAIARAEDLAALIDLGTEELEDYEVPEEVDPGEVEQGFDFLEEVLTDIERWFKDDAVDELAFVNRMWKQGPSMIGDAASQGYLTDNDGEQPRLAVLFVQPASDSQSMEVVAPLTDLVREETERVLAQHEGLEAVVTGMPALATDELRLVSRDFVIASLFAGCGVLAVFVFAFRSLRVSLFVVLPLVAGLAWTSGLAGALYGHLTLITGYFAAVLFGLGVPFTLHIVARFHEALRQGKTNTEAAETALVGAGPGVVVGGATTALAFAAIAFSEFQGFAELGVIAGAGVALILLANLTLLPAALVLWHPGTAVLPKAPRTGAFFVRLARSRTLVPSMAAAAMVAGAILAPRIGFDYAVESMLPSDSESVQGMRMLDDRTDFSTGYAVAVADSLEEAERLRLEFEAQPTVSRAEAVTQFVPTGQPAKLEILGRVDAETRKAAEAASKAVEARRQAPGRVTADKLGEAIRDFADTMQDLAFDAKRAGREEAGRLFEIAERAAAVSRLVSSSSDERARLLEQEFGELLSRGFGVLIGGLEDEGFGVDDLPETIRRRYVGRDGEHFAVIAFPAGDVGERDFLWSHADELLAVDEGTTGHTVTHRHFTRMVFEGFFEAVLMAAGAVVLLVLLDLRRRRELALALVPVVVGGGVTALVLYLTDFKMNYGNLMALPILIGTGVDYGAHLAHRAMQEGSVMRAAFTTGRTIALSGLTTLIGFGSLIVGNHWGVRSLGLILVLGIVCCLLVALVVVPGVYRSEGGVDGKEQA
jgi:hopanoid biosynthesis associated RND transporter like protein HpnN